MDRLFAGHTYNCAFRVYYYNNKAILLFCEYNSFCYEMTRLHFWGELGEWLKIFGEMRRECCYSWQTSTFLRFFAFVFNVAVAITDTCVGSHNNMTSYGFMWIFALRFKRGTYVFHQQNKKNTHTGFIANRSIKYGKRTNLISIETIDIVKKRP